MKGLRVVNLVKHGKLNGMSLIVPFSHMNNSKIAHVMQWLKVRAESWINQADARCLCIQFWDTSQQDTIFGIRILEGMD